MLFLPAATPCSPDFTRKTGACGPVERPHPPWGGAGGPEWALVPFILIAFHSCLPTNFPRRGPPPLRLAPRPARSAPARESLAASCTCPAPAGPSPSQNGRRRTGWRAGPATPRGGYPRRLGWGPPRARPCGSDASATHLLGAAGRCSAPGPRGGGGLLARLGHSEAATSAASGRARRRLEGRLPGAGRGRRARP